MRISADDTMQQGIMKMVEGNPGAVNVCVDLLKFGQDVNPEAGLTSGMVYIMTLDLLQIYGSRIWMLYKDVCGESISKMVAVLVAGANEIITQKELDLAIDGTGLRLDLETLIDTVVEQYPELGIAYGPRS